MYKEPEYLDLSADAVQAGLTFPVRLSEAAWRRCIEQAHDKDLVRWDLAWMLFVQLRIDGTTSLASGGVVRYAVDLNLSGDTPDEVDLMGFLQDFMGTTTIRVCLEGEPREDADRATNEGVFELLLVQMHKAIMSGSATPIERVYYFPDESLDGKHMWFINDTHARYQVRPELYMRASADDLSPLVAQLKPILSRHPGGIVTCETRAEARALTDALNIQLTGVGKAGLRFALGTSPDNAEERKKLRKVIHALEEGDIDYLVVTRDFDEPFLSQWSLWVDLCRYIHPVSFLKRLQELLRISIGKSYAEAVTFQTITREHLREQLLLWGAIKTDHFQGGIKHVPPRDDAEYRGHISARYDALVQLESSS